VGLYIVLNPASAEVVLLLFLLGLVISIPLSISFLMCLPQVLWGAITASMASGLQFLNQTVIFISSRSLVRNWAMGAHRRWSRRPVTLVA
jgi:hypothetical protein